MKHWLPSPQPHHSYAHINELAYRAIRAALFPRTRTRAIRSDAHEYREARVRTTEALRKAVMQ